MKKIIELIYISKSIELMSFKLSIKFQTLIFKVNREVKLNNIFWFLTN